MKKICLFVGLMVVCIIFPVSVGAQNYDKLWKEVESFQKKDHPRSVIEKSENIFSLAVSDKNLPQMIKAFMTFSEYKVKLSYDSLQVQKDRLKEWAASETDTVGKAVLNSITAMLYAAEYPLKIDSVISCLQLSLKEKRMLASCSAGLYSPVVITKELSKEYFGDNMYDFLARQAIRVLLDMPSVDNEQKIHDYIIGIYDSLIALYSDTDSPFCNKKAEALTREAKLVYLSDHCVYFKNKLSFDESLKELKKLALDFQDVDVYCDIVLKLAHKYNIKNKKVEAMFEIRKALELYPETRWTEDLKRFEYAIMAPELRVNIPFVYPGYRTNIEVSYNNITSITIEAYRLDLPPYSEKLGRDRDSEQIIKKYGTRVAVNNYTLPSTVDYMTRKTELKYKLPDAGIYMLKLYSKQKEEACYEVAYVSPYQCVLISLPEDKMEIIAVDRMTGHPVPNAEVVSFVRKNEKYEIEEVYQTDDCGSVVIDKGEKEPVYYSVRTSGNDFMRPSSRYLGKGGFWFNETPYGAVTRTKLFSDRSIYRPGQSIFVSGIIYSQEGDSLSVLKNTETSVWLRDANSKIVEKVNVVTDEFGVFSTTFQLKQNAVAGTYYISTDNHSEMVRVEEYKRPTFDVIFSKMDDVYSFGDSIRAEAKAESFAGSPLRMANVKYKIVREDVSWPRRNWSKTELLSGETITDADGKFYIDFHLLKPENDGSLISTVHSLFNITATVTSLSGETQVGEYSVLVGGKSINLNISGLPNKLAKEKIGNIRFEVSNNDGIPIDTIVQYDIYRLDSESNIVGKAVFSSEVHSRKSFVPHAFLSLASGKYRIKASAADIKGRDVSCTQDFVLFSLTDNVPPSETAWWFYKNGDSFSDGREVELYVGSSEEDIYLMLDVFTANKRIESKRIVISKSVRKFSYKYKEEYGDGITVCLTAMRDGQLYQEAVMLDKPRPEKELVIKWKTFRDKLLPGQPEEWKITVRDKAGNPVSASMLASAYDASLDKFSRHNWYFSHYFKRKVPSVYIKTLYVSNQFYMTVPYKYDIAGNGLEFIYSEDFTCFMPLFFNYYGARRAIMTKTATPVEHENAVVLSHSSTDNNLDTEEDAVNAGGIAETDNENNIPVLRENFSETAFYYPCLRTDSTGTVTISFVMPDALTKWNFNGFVHTKEMDYGIVNNSFTTSKPFMVQPNMPRFVRVGDESSISSSLINMSDGDISGKITMTISNPISGKVLYSKTDNFNVTDGETGVVTFNYKVEEGIDLLVCTIMAEAGEFSDGERHYLPVLTDKQLIVENIPAQLRGDEARTIETNKLFNGGSKTAANKKLTVEMTANPQWYVIQALPVLGVTSSDDAMSWATALYANSLSLHIVKSNPKIRQVFETWMLQGKSDKDFWSELSRNEELKNIIIAETPWMAETESEASRKQRIALLFDVNGMDDRLSTAVSSLERLQLSDGSWSWFKGMSSSSYITLQIVQSLARLKNLGIKFDTRMDQMYSKALGYLATEVAECYNRILKDKKSYMPQDMIICYLYICAVDKEAASRADTKVNSYFVNYFMGKSASLNIQEKSVMSTVMDTFGKKNEAKVLLQSVMEYMVNNREMGSYFDTYKADYSSFDYRIPTHVSAMEAIMRLGENKVALLDDMRLWLLKQKQVQVWDTPISSVNAIYAFLADESCQLDSTSVMRANIGNKTITTPEDAIGNVSVSLQGTEVDSVQNVYISRNGSGTGWASVYAQYLENMDKVKSYNGGGLKIERKYMCNGKEVVSYSELSVGDKIAVCLTISSDRDMDFVRIKDEKPACFEVASQLSSYYWDDGLSYYRVNKDASVEFFIDCMRKGTYTICYDAYVTRSGNYVSGAASLISVYAPQFGSHTEGFRINVK